MSLLLLVYWIFTQTLAIVEAAPKLEQKAHDSIKADKIETSIQSKPNIDDSSSDGYLSVDLPMPELRSDDKSEEGTGFAGYIFDERICKLLGGRILCGYNRNKGEYDNTVIIDLGNGCFMRNDRIECGYKLPFNGDSANLRAKPTRTTNFETKTSQQGTAAESFTTKNEIRTNNKNESNPMALLIELPASVSSEPTTSEIKTPDHKEPKEISSNIKEQFKPTAPLSELPVSVIPESTTSEIKIANQKEPEEYVTATQKSIKQSDVSERTNTSSLPSTLTASVRSNNMSTSQTTEYNTTQSSTSFPIASEANLMINKVKLTRTAEDLANDVLLEKDNETVNTNEDLDPKQVESINKEIVAETQT